jgi:hypothetical protein
MDAMKYPEAKRVELAKLAFWGKLEALYEECCGVEGYWHNGEFHPANGLSGIDVINVVLGMDDEQIGQCLAVDGYEGE